METVIEKIYARHKEWLYIVTKYGCNRDTAEDIVQDMYVRIILYIQRTGNDIMYGDDINIYFVVKTLKSIFVDQVRKDKRKDAVSYDEESYAIEGEQEYDYEEAYTKVQDMLKEMHWFDKKVYEIIEGGEKISTLASKSTIPYYTVYNTYKKVKKHLKDNI